MSRGDTTETVYRALRALHPTPTWLTYREAAISSTTSRLDFFAMHAQRWSGHTRVAYEVKANRADFLRELDRPEKRAHALGLSHEFYFACPEGLIREEELPDEAGLVWVGSEEPHARIVRPAPIREARPLTDTEIVYLVRYAWFRERLEADRAELRRLRQEVASLRRTRLESRPTENQGSQFSETPATSVSL